MDVLLDEYEEILQTNIRSFLDTECPTSVVREMEEDPLGYPPDVWRKMAELGWLGLALPEEYGGAADSLLHLGILFEEVGRVVAPVPILSTLVSALTIAEYGTDAQRNNIIPAVIGGDMVMTWAVGENDHRVTAESVHMSAAPEGDGYTLSGGKLFVDNFNASAQVLVACRTAPAADGNDGISLFIVDSGAPGITTELLPTLSGEKQYKLEFAGVKVRTEDLLGELNAGWPIVEWMLTRATALSCAMIVGATRRAIDMAFGHAKDRVVFGRPLGSFQAIQHMCADMVIWVDGAQLLTYEARWKLSEGLPATVEVATAKAFANERCQAALRDANQIHGGIAQIKEFDLQLWYRRASSWTMKLGTTSEHRRANARGMGIA